MHDTRATGDVDGGAPASGWTETDLEVRLRQGAGGAVRVEGVLCSAPVWLRWDGATLWLVGSGASPVGEDRIRVCVDVGPGLHVTVRSVAATVVYAARGAGTTWDTVLRVAGGASLDWRPEPVILTERARHAATTVVEAAADASLTLDEVLVLGRDDEPTGMLRSTLDVSVGGRRTLLTSNDTSVRGWSGPSGTGGSRIVATRLRLGDRSDHQRDAGEAVLDGDPAADEWIGTTLDPSDGCRLAVATASDVALARRSLDVLLPD